MGNARCLLFSAAVLFPFAAAVAQTPAAGSGSGKIICWKDKSGKVIGCGDVVPLEYRDSATKELDRRGITIRQSDAALTPEQRKAQQAELERKQAEERSNEARRRQDRILLDTYSNEGDIKYDRGRRTQEIESDIDSLQVRLKKSIAGQANARARAEQFRKLNKPAPTEARDELDRIAGETAKIENQIAQKRKDIAALNKKYDEIRKRYLELTEKPSSGGSAGSPAAAAGAVSGRGGK